MKHLTTTPHPRTVRWLALLLLAILALCNCDLFDIFPPEIEIVSPRDNASYVDTLSCDIDATDNRGVTKVEVYLDDVSIHEFTDTPYKASLDISGQSAGTKTFKATAQDKAGNHSEAQCQVQIIKESVSAPTRPIGPSSGTTSTSYTYSTSGVSSSLGHSLQYRFDWSDGYVSGWSSSSTASHSWDSTGTKNVKAQARCASHTSVESGWSSSKSVTISSETISTPSTPSGPSSGNVGTSYSYSTGGSTSSIGHNIQYRFDWEDGTYSNWSSSTTASHSWSSAGTRNVKAQARCASHTSVVSSWSSTKTVTTSALAETASTPSTPSGNSSGNTNNSYSYSTGGSSSNLGHSIQYRFDWGDGNYSTWSTSTSASHSWSSAGTYSVKAQARCATHTGVESTWSSGIMVVISEASITITSPNGGENWQELSSQTITWTTSGDVGSNVSLYFSLDGGVTWTEITASTLNDDSYDWTLPNVIQTETTCRVKVTSITGNITDSSNGDFSIVDIDYITLTSPTGGEEWVEGTSQSITWDYSGNSGVFVLLESSDDGGTTWSPIIASTDNDGVYDWTLPDLTVTQRDYLIRITSISASYSDMSDNYFTVLWSPPFAGTYDTPGSAYSVFVAGDYAYVADKAGDLQIINIDNKAAPTFTGTVSLPSSSCDVMVSGIYAYLANGSGGLQTVNISNPSSPSVIGSSPSADYSRGIFISGNYAYLADHFGGLRIINISNPASPSPTGSVDVQTQAWDVFVSGNYAYVPEYTSGDLKVVNISSPSSPFIVGTFTPYDDIMDVVVASDNAYVAGYGNGLHILDISNPSIPILLGSCDTPDLAEGVYVSGNYAFIADRYSGLRIIDVSDVSNPITVGAVDTPGFARRVFISGLYAYVADGDSGLQIYSLWELP